MGGEINHRSYSQLLIKKTSPGTSANTNSLKKLLFFKQFFNHNLLKLQYYNWHSFRYSEIKEFISSEVRITTLFYPD